MTIYIASAGRSGSAWLSTVLYHLGYNVSHEGNAVGLNPLPQLEVISDTRFVWHEDFVDNLTSNDKVILLTRSHRDIQKSIDIHLPGIDVVGCVLQLSLLQVRLSKAQVDYLVVPYHELFELAGYEKIRKYLNLYGVKAAQAWQYYKNMCIENIVCMKQCQQQWIEIQNEQQRNEVP